MLAKTPEHLERVRYSCRYLARLLYELRGYILPGVSLLQIDRYTEEFIRDHGGLPSFKGFHGFPNASCISVNEEVIHGIPSAYVLREGDIVGVDVGMNYQGAFGDAAYTYAVGEISAEKQKLLDVTQKALLLGIEQARCGNRVGDISYAIQSCSQQHSYGLVRDYCGHGVGSAVWEEPSIPNFGNKGLGPRLKENMIIAIEPMLNLGTHEVYVKDDGWTVVTRDQKASAHFEHTVLIRSEGTEILTQYGAT